MKKIVYSLSIAMAFGVAANAAQAPQQAVNAMASQTEAVKTAEVAQFKGVDLTFERVDSEGRKVKQEVSYATSVESFIGYWKWSAQNMISAEIFPSSGVMYIHPNESRPDRLVVENFVLEYPLDAYFDNDTKTLVIPNQYLYDNTYYNKEVWFTNYTFKWEINQAGEEVYEPVVTPYPYQFYFSINEEGRMRAGDIERDKFNSGLYTDEEMLRDVCLPALDMPDGEQGFFFLVWNLSGNKVNEFSFIEDEWQLLGDCTFNDAWLQVLWSNGVPQPYEVPLYYKKNAPGTYLLDNPYGPNSIYADANKSSKPGYVIFNISNPDCVFVNPFVYGCTIQLGDGADAFDAAIYPFNLEGLYKEIYNASAIDVIVQLGEENVSYLDQRTGEVVIKNALYSETLNIYNAYAWNGYTMEGSIILPGNYMDSVESILGEDNSNAPVEYFNLQGARVANPEKGQIVIVRKGNQVSKMIVR